LSSSDRAAELRELLNGASIAYYVDDVPVMDDVAYDTLYDELKALEAADPSLITPDSPTQRVGAPPSSEVSEGAPSVADGIARQSHDRRGAGEVGARRSEASRDR